jgi:hypothetical protein
MSEPDWAKLKAIGAEIETLQEQGSWDRAAFDRLFGVAKEAVHGHEEFLEFVVNEAEQAWL